LQLWHPSELVARTCARLLLLLSTHRSRAANQPHTRKSPGDLQPLLQRSGLLSIGNIGLLVKPGLPKPKATLLPKRL
jgi:hypothetical protein